MPVIAVTTPLYTDTQVLLKDLQVAWNLLVYGDGEIIAKTARDYRMTADLLERVIHASPIAFNAFTHERERVLAALGKTLSDLIRRDNCLLTGVICHLIPEAVTHVLRVLVMDDMEARIIRAIEVNGWSRPQAEKMIELADQERERWTREIKRRPPWDASLYALVIHRKDSPGQTAFDQIQKALSLPPYTGREPRENEVANLAVIADVQMALAPLGPGLIVDAKGGDVIVTIDKRRMNLPQTQARIMDAAKAVPGVVSAKTKIGPNYYRSEMIKTFDFDRSTGIVEWDTD